MTPISQVNSHIEDYLDYYTNLSQSPKFAILLKGKWGSGKSWFINKYIDKKKSENIKPLYVSLYGVNSFSQIEDSLREQISPFWNSKEMKIASKVLKNFIKLGFKIDWDGDSKPDANLTISPIDIEKEFKIKDSDVSLLIFDDLERCSLEIENILGYINTFVESQDLKVIIIANEEELEKKYEKKEDELNKYRRVKEKLIGKTFEIFADPESALQDFIKFVESEDLKEFLQQDDICKLIENLYTKGDHKNLRTLQQIIFDFERIFKKLPEKVQKNKLLLTDILTSLVVLSIEISKGELSIQEIIKIGIEARMYNFFTGNYSIQIIRLNIQSREKFNNGFKNNLGDKVEKNNQTDDDEKLKELKRQEKLYQDYQNTLGKYFFDDFIPSLEWWHNFFDKGIVEQEGFNNLLSNHRYNRYWLEIKIPEWQQKLFESPESKELEIMYLDFPIFCHINENDFFQKILKFYEHQDQKKITTFNTIKKRYENSQIYGYFGKLLEEAKFFCNINEKLKMEIEKRQGESSSYILIKIKEELQQILNLFSE